jgi:hypothetical protein
MVGLTLIASYQFHEARFYLGFWIHLRGAGQQRRAFKIS